MDYVSWALAVMGIAAAIFIVLLIIYSAGTGIASVINMQKRRTKLTHK